MMREILNTTVFRLGLVLLLLQLSSCSPNLDLVQSEYGIHNVDSYNEAFQDRYATLIREVAKKPEDADALVQLGYFYHANLLLQDAQNVYESALSRFGERAKWMYYSARIALDLGDQELALQRLSKVVDLDEGYAMAHFYLGELLLKMNKLDAAESAYEEYEQLGNEDAYAWLGLGRVAIARKDWTQAEGRILNSLRIDSKIVSAYSLLTTVYRSLGDEDRVVRVKRAARQGERYHQPRDPWMDELTGFCLEPYRLSVLASIEEASGRGEAGIVLLRRALALDPENSRLLFQLAESLKQMKRSDEVLSLLARAIEFDSEYESAHYAFVSELEQMGRSEEALVASARAIEQASGASGLWRQRGVLLEAAGAMKEARSLFLKAIELEPTESKNETALANHLWALGERAEAIEHYERVRTLSPVEANSRAVLASYYLGEKDFETAGNCIEEAAEIDPSLEGLTELKVQYRLVAGSEKLAEGDLKSAMAHFENGLKSDPQHLDTMVRLVAVYLESGQVTEARGIARRLVKAHPREAIAYRVMGGVEMKAGNQAAAQQWMQRANSLSTK